MSPNFIRTSCALAALALSAVAAQASPIAVTSYDMSNGDGQAHGGSYNYWDTSYSGAASAGATNIDGQSGNTLSGGTGKLTDGVIATSSWYDVSNGAGTGPYVGWLSPTSTTITFHFGGVVDLDEIKLYVDNSNVGGVSAPNNVTINGNSFANTLYQTPSAPTVLDFTGLGIHGDSVTLSMNYANGWVFLSEAQFFSPTAAVPEADNLAMILGGLSLFAFMARRRRG